MIIKLTLEESNRIFLHSILGFSYQKYCPTIKLRHETIHKRQNIPSAKNTLWRRVLRCHVIMNSRNTFSIVYIFASVREYSFCVYLFVFMLFNRFLWATSQRMIKPESTFLILESQARLNQLKILFHDRGCTHQKFILTG